jgi:hypothetical protein
VGLDTPFAKGLGRNHVAREFAGQRMPPKKFGVRRVCERFTGAIDAAGVRRHQTVTATDGHKSRADGGTGRHDAAPSEERDV